MKKRLLAILLCMGLFLGAFPAAAAEETISPGQIRSNGSPYYIMVNRRANVVTVYGLDESGFYSVPVRAMVCSTGREGHETPLGTFSTTGKYDWLSMVDGTYGQYGTRFNKKILFHSICYSRLSPSSMLTEEYNLLGEPASLGCVRLQVGDAKWIYDNCPLKTGVTVYEADDPGPLGKPETLVGKISPEQDNRWDPTDPREKNPWNALLTRSVTLAEEEIALTAGERISLSALRQPENTALPVLTWTSSDPETVSVDENGTVTALKNGTAEVTVRCGESVGVCLVAVGGVSLPFSDVSRKAWYYEDVRFVWEKGMLAGDGAGHFLPEKSLSEDMVLQILFRMAGREEAPAEGERWYAPALRWAEENGLRAPSAKGDPEKTVTRQELASMLYRFHVSLHGEAGEETAELSRFSDWVDVDPMCERALSWAVAKELLKGTETGRLLPTGTLTRAQMAAILHRYLEE